MEIWKDIEAYEGYYQVSDMGRVRSLDRFDGIGRRRKGRVLAACDNGNGYKYVVLKRNGDRVNMYIHRLVALHFLSNQENMPEINHLDENKSNNKSENLQWVTRIENMNYGTVRLRQRESIDFKRRVASKRVKVTQYSCSGIKIKTWESMSDAARSLGKKSNSAICMCCQGKRRTGYGFIWKLTGDVNG